MCQKLRNLVFHTLVPAVLAALLLPIMAFAKVSSCSVSIPVEIKVTGSRIPADVPYRLVLKAVTPEAQVWASDEAAGDEKTDSIVFTNNYRRPGGGGGDSGGGSDSDPDPNPGTNPNPGPGGSGTEVPRGDGLTVIGDNETPLGGFTLIPEEGVPLGGLPKTGDTTMLSFWILLAVLSGSGLAALAFIRKRME